MYAERNHAKVMELARQAEIVKEAIADKAIAVIEQYRKGEHHGREVSIILAKLFEAANDTVERMVVDAVGVDRLGYGRMENNPSLVPNAEPNKEVSVER